MSTVVKIQSAQLSENAWAAVHELAYPVGDKVQDSGRTEDEAVESTARKYFGKSAFQIWKIAPGEWEAVSSATIAPSEAKKKAVAASATERKRRSRAGRVSVSFDLDPDMYQRLESLAKRYGSKKAALEAFLLSSDQMSLPI